MPLKVAVTGKGGTGKSTLAGVLAHLFRERGASVLAVDADPDANLASALGVPREEAKRLLPISARRELIKERTGANPSEFGQLFKLNPTVADIPDEYSLTYRGIKLLVMGAVKKGGGGCACPENVLLRSLLEEIILRRDEAVIVDMEAGIEHLGRGTARAIDRMLIMVEPGSRSVETARAIMRLASDIGIGRFGIVASKVRTADEGEWIRGQFPAGLVLGNISYSETILDADRRELPLIDHLDGPLRQEFESVFRAVLEDKKAEFLG
jgi:CO dehydrogenase maturation factor